jgi:gluconate 2-dehydrogenase gamma chain
MSGAACGRRGNFRTFSDAEARTIDALLGWIIPADDAPGAREAGVVHYIDRQLCARFREHRKLYRDGIAAAGNFAVESPERQQQMIRELERSAKPFFDLLVTHAMQGFYGNPRHGGNRDFASWQMLGIPPVPVRGRDGYDLTKGGRNAQG